MLGRLWTKGRTSQYSGRSLTSRSLESSSSHIGSYSLQSPLLFVSCLDEPKVAQPVHKQINEHKDRPVAVNKSFCHLRLRMIVQDLSLHVPRYPSFLFAARPKISRTLLRFGLEAWICDLSGAISDRLMQILQSFSDIKLSSLTKSAGSMHDCRTTLPGSYPR